MKPPDPSPRLALGTVQFGIPYGISNTGGQVAPEEASGILEAAIARDPNAVIDTAPGYGDSENVLGGLLPPLPHLRIVTKTNLKHPDVRQAFMDSLGRLCRPSAYALLDHNAAKLFGQDGSSAWRAMQDLKEAGLVRKIGASVYTAEDIDRLLLLGPIDIVQVPVSVVDQRLPRSGHLRKLAERGVEIHIRSAFLQGLLLMPADSLPSFFTPYKPLLQRFHAACREAGTTPLAGALGYLKSLAETDHIVVGVTRLSEWKEIAHAFDTRCPALDWASFHSGDPDLLNPARWPPKE